MEPRISIITLGVRNMEESYRFYHDGLGFPTTSTPDKEIIVFQTSGVRLALYPLQALADDVAPGLSAEKNAFPGITLAHNTRTRDEVEQVLKLAESSGGKIVKQAGDVFWGGYSGYFSDPDGYFWEVVWYEGIQFNPDGSLVID